MQYLQICMHDNMLYDRLLNKQPVLPIIAQFTAHRPHCFTTHTQTCWHARSSVTRKTATGCGLGTKTFSELSEDARSQDAPSQNVKNFRCQNRQAQALIWGEMMLKQQQHSGYLLQRWFACFWQPQDKNSPVGFVKTFKIKEKWFTQSLKALVLAYFAVETTFKTDDSWQTRTLPLKMNL